MLSPLAVCQGATPLLSGLLRYAHLPQSNNTAVVSNLIIKTLQLRNSSADGVTEC